jgi:hypothetical protein
MRSIGRRAEKSNILISKKIFPKERLIFLTDIPQKKNIMLRYSSIALQQHSVVGFSSPLLLFFTLLVALKALNATDSFGNQTFDLYSPFGTILIS